MLTRSRAASLAGLAPVTRESGHWKGRSFIQGGRHRVRRMLYMPAVVAVQHNPDLKRKYEALVARGKPPKGLLLHRHAALHGGLQTAVLVNDALDRSSAGLGPRHGGLVG